MMTLLRPSRRLSPLSWLFGTLSLITTMASAQAPVSTYGMAYTTIDESTLYIQGGIILPPPGGTASKITSQFYALDLTQDWNATSPPWKALTNNATQFSSQSMTISPDRQTLTLWSVYPTVALNYSIADASRTRVPFSAGPIISGSGLHAATDPATGAVYILGEGLLNTYMGRYNYLTGSINWTSIPLAPVPVLDSYSFVWCQPRKSFLLFAGNISSANAIFEYSLSMGRWNQLLSTGAAPSFRRGSCMVPAYNGTKIILFGGDGVGSSVASISILDIQTMVWASGKDAPDARSDMACAVAGDNFVVWGGRKMLSDESAAVPTTPLIYNIKTGKWTEKFIRGTNGNKTEGAPGGVPGTGSGGGFGSGSSGSGSGSGSVGGGVGPIVGGGSSIGSGEVVGGGGITTTSGAAIGGGVAVGVGVLAGIIFLFIQRRRQRSTKDFEMVLPNMSMMPSPAEDRADLPGLASNEYHQSKFNSQQQQQEEPLEMSYNNVQYTLRDEPPGVSGLPPSYSASSRSRPAIPSYYEVTGIPGDPRELVRQLSR